MSNPTALGVYIYAGGFTLGVKQAGFSVLAQLEDGPFGVASTRANFPKLDVRTPHAVWWPDDFRGDVDFIYANPPCAPFSNAAVSTRKKGKFADWWRTDPRVSCIRNVFELLEVVRPHVWAWESVQGAYRRGRDLVDELTCKALDLGYSATYVLLNAAEIGVPQTRRRFFCIFHDVEIDWRYPCIPKHLQMTVRQALKGVSKGTRQHPHGKQDTELLPYTKQGEGTRNAWERVNPPETYVLNAQGHVKGRPCFSSRRLSWDKPANTMIGGPCQYHPTKHRFLSLREAQVICGYPPSYEFIGQIGDCYAQVARAVMPPVGRWLALNVKRALLKDEEFFGHVREVNLEKRTVTILPDPRKVKALA